MSTPNALLSTIEDHTATVAVLGCGYVGLTLAYHFAQAGLPVLGVDTNDLRTKELTEGNNPVPDVDIDEAVLRQLLDAGTIRFSTSLDERCDIYVICVNTPLRDGSPDLRYVESAGDAVAGKLAAGNLVVLESTTYPGTTEELLLPLLEEASGLRAGHDFALAHSPERINPASTEFTLRSTPKIVGGLDADSTAVAAALYGQVCEEVVTVSSPRTAEITKLYENSYRVVNIALANEMAVVCRDFDIDPWEMLEAASTKPYGFTPFKPGPGVGGECIPIDPQYLAWRVRGISGRQFRLLETASDVNERMPPYIAQRAAEILNDEGMALRGAKVLALGVAYKGGSGDTRVSPAMRVCDRLAASGADLSYHDQFVPSVEINGTRYEHVDLTADAVESSALVVILTDHPDVDYQLVLDRAPIVFDTRGITLGMDAKATLYRF